MAAGAIGGATALTTRICAASFGNPDAPQQGAVDAGADPSGLTTPGPHSDALSGQLPSSVSPPPTDGGAMPEFWASFNNAQRRIQEGGWARQVTQDSVPISKTIAGVDMRLSVGGIRELHWHVASEWAYVTHENVPLTHTYIFQGELPGPLAADREAVTSPLGPPPIPSACRSAPCPSPSRPGAATSRSSTAAPSRLPPRRRRRW